MPSRPAEAQKFWPACRASLHRPHPASLLHRSTLTRHPRCTAGHRAHHRPPPPAICGCWTQVEAGPTQRALAQAGVPLHARILVGAAAAAHLQVGAAVTLREPRSGHLHVCASRPGPPPPRTSLGWGAFVCVHRGRGDRHLTRAHTEGATACTCLGRGHDCLARD